MLVHVRRKVYPDDDCDGNPEIWLLRWLDCGRIWIPSPLFAIASKSIYLIRVFINKWQFHELIDHCRVTYHDLPYQL
jgi:hypothetical protein